MLDYAMDILRCYVLASTCISHLIFFSIFFHSNNNNDITKKNVYIINKSRTFFVTASKGKMKFSSHNLQHSLEQSKIKKLRLQTNKEWMELHYQLEERRLNTHRRRACLVKRIVGTTRGCNGNYANNQRRNEGDIQEVSLTEVTAYGDCCICNHSSKRPSFCRQKAAIERSTWKPGWHYSGE